MREFKTKIDSQKGFSLYDNLEYIHTVLTVFKQNEYIQSAHGVMAQ